MDVPVEVLGVFEIENSDSPFVLLRDSEGRNIPIWVGPCEAVAIQTVLSGTIPSRPLTHDLALTLLERLGATLERVVIDDLSNKVFYAKLHLSTATVPLEIDARPSDALALALRAQAPVLISDAVAEEAKLDHDIQITEEEIEHLGGEEPDFPPEEEPPAGR